MVRSNRFAPGTNVAAPALRGNPGAPRALYRLMQILFSEPARYAADPPGLILSAAEAARQAALRAAAPPRRPGR